MVGIVAFMAAFELQGQTESGAGKTNILQKIEDLPGGTIILALIALGLLCYTIWRFIQAFYDTQGKGSDAKGAGKRIRYVFSGVVYGALAFFAARMVLGNGGGSSGSGGDTRQTLVSELLQQPFGQWLVGILAVATMLIGVYQIYYGYSDKYRKHVRSGGLKDNIEQQMIRAGKVGYMARGVVWLVIGYLFLQAALQSNPNRAGGSSKAFQFLESTTYGSIILGAVALGLVCYGIFAFMRAKYQPIYKG